MQWILWLIGYRGVGTSLTRRQRVWHWLGWHDKESFCENVHADAAGGIFTIGGWQCRCGRSKLRFIYHS